MRSGYSTNEIQTYGGELPSIDYDKTEHLLRHSVEREMEMERDRGAANMQ